MSTLAEARHLVRKLLTIRATNGRRTGKAWREARAAWLDLAPVAVHGQRIVAELDAAKHHRAEPHVADYFLWNAFVWACDDRADEIRAELMAILPCYLIPNATVWFMLHPRPVETNFV